MLVSDVVTAVRKRLGDTEKERWDAETLALYTSLCQNDICILTNFHRLYVEIPLYENVFIYNLPTDCIRVERIEYNDEFFPVESRNNIDKGEAQFPCALKDNLLYGHIEIRMERDGEPLSDALNDAFGVISANDLGQTLENAFGVVTSLEDDLNPNIDQGDAIGKLRLYYSAVPPLVNGLDDTLVVPDMWIAAFIHYVTAMALQDDNDGNNIQRGELEAQKYQRMLQQLFKTSAKDFTTNYKSKLTTTLRRI